MIQIKKGLLSDKLKDEISKRYFESIKQMGDSQFSYVKRRIDKKLRLLRSPSSDFLEMSVAELAWPMWVVLQEEKDRMLFEWSSDAKKLIAALYYLCTPDDIIPDFDKIRGYADDAYVINEFFKDIESTSMMNKIIHQINLLHDDEEYEEDDF